MMRLVRFGVGWRLERAPRRAPLANALAVAAAILAAVLACILLFLAAGARPGEALAALARGAFGSWRAAAETLVKATPLIFTGLGTAVAFRARLWNIGAEGQVFAGAMFAYWCVLNLHASPAVLQIPVVIVGAMIGGATLAALAGALRAWFAVDEVVSTVMLNYIIGYALSLLLQRGPWSEAGGFFEQTAKVAPGSTLPILLEGTRLHAGFPLALAMVTLIGLLLARTPLGLEIRAAGSNLRALAFQGTSAARVVILTMALSGAIAGLAGATEVFGVHQRVKAGAVAGYGYTGVIVAILGGLRPWGVVAAAILFGALVNGSTLMQIETGVPSALVYAVEAIALLSFLAGRAAGSFRLRRTGGHAG